MYKLVIVDDELTEIKFVRYVIDTYKLPFYVCGEGENGEEGVELVRKHGADFVIMDINMPLMNGLTASKIIKQEYPDTKIYLLTAYQSFEYARQAVKVDVEDYLLKPIRPEQLVEVLKKGITEVLRQRLSNREITKIKQKVESAKPLLKRQLMLELVTGGKTNHQIIASMKNVLGLGQINPAGVLVATICDKAGKVMTGSRLLETFMKKIDDNGDPGLSELLPSGEIVVMFKTWTNKTQKTLNQTIEEWKQMSEIQVHGGFAPLTGEGNIPSAYEFADKIRRTAFFWRKTGIFLLPQLGSIQDCLTNITAVEKTVFNCLLDRKLDEAHEAIQGLFIHLENHFVPQDQVIPVANQLVNSLLHDLVEQIPGNQAGSIIQQYMEKTGSIDHYEHLKDSLVEVINRIITWFSLSNETQTEQSINWAASYIRQNYREEITLEQMAGRLFLSPSYFSRMFKKQLGEGFASFVTKTRMEHARNLLASGKLSVSQVAKQVGYYDASYFSTVYKKYFGISPQNAIAPTEKQEIKQKGQENK